MQFVVDIFNFYKPYYNDKSVVAHEPYKYIRNTQSELYIIIVYQFNRTFCN